MIDRFDGEHRFLSNFWPATVTVLGIPFPSVEHAYQATKLPLTTPDRLGRMRQVAALPHPGQAKHWGRTVRLRPDWERVKLPIMRSLLQRKFSIAGLDERLIATHPHELVEGNTWGDRFWGVCQGTGQNHLGRLLMDVRSGLTP